MLEAYGWIIVRASRDPLAEVTAETSGLAEKLDALDRMLDDEDERIWDGLGTMLARHGDPWLRWSFVRNFNNTRGLLQLSTSTNHRVGTLWNVLSWIGEYAIGSYGLIYVRDDEDTSNRPLGMPMAPTHDEASTSPLDNDPSNAFRVWRLLHGRLDEFADPFLSPIVPTIDPNEFA